MAYYRSRYVSRGPGKRPQAVFQALGDYSDSTPCSQIPAGDPYRKPGNYCTQPSGNVIEFNSDGSVDPDPFASGSAKATAGGGGASSGGIWQAGGQVIGGLASALFGPKQPVAPASSGMSTGTILAIAGAGVLALVLLARR